MTAKFFIIFFFQLEDFFTKLAASSGSLGLAVIRTRMARIYLTGTMAG
jgi:hypothetical protein